MIVTSNIFVYTNNIIASGYAITEIVGTYIITCISMHIIYIVFKEPLNTVNTLRGHSPVVGLVTEVCCACVAVDLVPVSESNLCSFCDSASSSSGDI